MTTSFICIQDYLPEFTVSYSSGKRHFEIYSLPRFQLTVAHICHGKTYFSTAKLTFPRQNLLFHGKTYFLTAKLTFPRQNLLFYGKTYFSTAKLTFPRQKLLFHGKTYFSIPSFQSVSAYAFPRRRSGNFQQSNMADGEEDYV